MSITELTPVPSRRPGTKRRGPYLVTKIERGLFEERHESAGTVRYRFRFTDAEGTRSEVVLNADSRKAARDEAAKVKAKASEECSLSQRD